MIFNPRFSNPSKEMLRDTSQQQTHPLLISRDTSPSIKNKCRKVNRANVAHGCQEERGDNHSGDIPGSLACPHMRPLWQSRCSPQRLQTLLPPPHFGAEILKSFYSKKQHSARLLLAATGARALAHTEKQPVFQIQQGKRRKQGSGVSLPRATWAPGGNPQGTRAGYTMPGYSGVLVA